MIHMEIPHCSAEPLLYNLGRYVVMSIVQGEMAPLSWQSQYMTTCVLGGAWES